MTRLGALTGLLFLVASSQAFAIGSLADVAIYDRSGARLLPVYTSDGRYYVAGRTGGEYEIRIRNNTGGDLLAVVSVDGVNVVSGETAAPSQGGYVVAAWRSVTIAGWRKSVSRVAAFYFTEHDNAYATLTGRPDDVGVIGVALFRRKMPPPADLDEPATRGFSSAPNSARREGTRDARSKLQGDADGAAAGASAENAQRPAAPQPMEKSLGTGHGRNETSLVRYVSFERESDAPNEVIVMGYDTRANLVARGIIPTRSERDPNPFPSQFAPDPPTRW